MPVNNFIFDAILAMNTFCDSFSYLCLGSCLLGLVNHEYILFVEISDIKQKTGVLLLLNLLGEEVGQ